MTNRTRTITWDDPVALAKAAAGLSGLEYLHKIISGELPPPPIGLLMDFRIAEIGEGRAVFVVTPAEYHYNPIGVVHGGLALTLLDSCMSCSIQTTLAKGELYTTLEAKVNLVRAITKDTGLVRATGRLIHRGRTTGTAEGDIRDKAGNLLAHGTTTCVIFPAKRA